MHLLETGELFNVLKTLKESLKSFAKCARGFLTLFLSLYFIDSCLIFSFRLSKPKSTITIVSAKMIDNDSDGNPRAEFTVNYQVQ